MTLIQAHCKLCSIGSTLLLRAFIEYVTLHLNADFKVCRMHLTMREGSVQIIGGQGFGQVAWQSGCAQPQDATGQEGVLAA